MQKTVFIHLHDAALNSVSWIILDNNQPTSEIQIGSIDDLAAVCNNNKVVLVIPGTILTLTTIQLPATDRERMQRALPYAMEERIIDDVESMHFSINDWNNNQVSVSAISRQQLDALIERFNNASIQLDYVIPDIFLVPYAENIWTVVLTGKYALIRTGQHSGLAVDSYNLQPILAMNLAQAAKLPATIRLLHKNDTEQLAAETLLPDSPSITVSEEIYTNEFVKLFSENFTENSPYNLLQGDYSKHEQIASIWKAWRPVAIFTAIMLILYVTLLSINIYRLDEQITAVDNQIRLLFKKTLPDVRKIVNPKVQLQQHISQLKQVSNNSESSFLALLGKSANSLAANKDIKIISLNYKDSKLDIELVIENFQKLDQLKSSIEAQGIATEILSATADDKSVLGRIRLSGKK